MSRTQTAPGRWRDDGPATPHTVLGRFDPRPAVVIGAMRPVIRGYVLSQNRDLAVDDAHAKADARLRQKFSIRPENRYQPCAVPLMGKGRDWKTPTGERCARIAGHADTHRSRATMDAEADRRRSTSWSLLR